MSKKDEQKANLDGHDTGGIKVRVIEFELHGRNATVAEGIKAITSAISGRAVIVPEPRRPALPAIPKTATETTTTTATTIDAEQIAEPNDTVVESAQEEEAPLVGQPTNGNGAPKRGYKFKAPTFLHELDLTTATKQLAEYVAEKGNPTDILDKYLIVSVWLKDHMKIEDFTINHIYTAFANLNWKADMPDNHSQPLRDLSKKHYLTKTKTGYQVGWQGNQYVEKMK